jgi:hypothetical protein
LAWLAWLSCLIVRHVDEGCGGDEKTSREACRVETPLVRDLEEAAVEPLEHTPWICLCRAPTRDPRTPPSDLRHAILTQALYNEICCGTALYYFYVSSFCISFVLHLLAELLLAPILTTVLLFRTCYGRERLVRSPRDCLCVRAPASSVYAEGPASGLRFVDEGARSASPSPPRCPSSSAMRFRSGPRAGS